MRVDDLVGTDERVVAVGIDTASLPDTARSLDAFGDRYLRRVCSPREMASLPTDPAERLTTLTRLWAAKEAATKALAPSDRDRWAWPAVEIDLRAGRVHLAGRAQELAAEAGIDRVCVAGVDESSGTTTPLGAGGPSDALAGAGASARTTVVALALERSGPPTGRTDHPLPRRTP